MTDVAAVSCVCALVLLLQEEFLSSEFRQLVERCRVVKSDVDTLAHLKIVPGIIFLSI